MILYNKGSGDKIFSMRLHTFITVHHVEPDSRSYSHCRDLPPPHGRGQLLKGIKILYGRKIYISMQNFNTIGQTEVFRKC